MEHISEIRADPAIAHGWWHGLRMPGTNIPGVLTAGTFYQDGKRVFWDIHNPENTVVIRTEGRTAAHELEPSSRDDAKAAIEIMEHLLNYFYDLDYKASLVRNASRGAFKSDKLALFVTERSHEACDTDLGRMNL
jgi:hypothetical protein